VSSPPLACERCGSFAPSLEPRADGVRLCAQCWPAHSRLPLRLRPAVLWGLLWRPGKTLAGIAPSDAGAGDLVWVAVLAVTAHVSSQFLVLVADGVERAMPSRGLPPLLQLASDLVSATANAPLWIAAAAVVALPVLDSGLLPGAERARPLLRHSILSLTPFVLTAPLQLGLALCGWGALRGLHQPGRQGLATACLLGALALVAAQQALPLWVLLLRARLLRAGYRLSWLRAAVVALGAPAIVVAMLFGMLAMLAGLS
jgi:hypothetical protein